jgi:hypothetical protein
MFFAHTHPDQPEPRAGRPSEVMLTWVDVKSRQSRVETVSSKYFDELVTLTKADTVRNNGNNMFPCGRSQ